MYHADYSDIRLPPVAMRDRQQRRQQRAQATHSRISNAEGEGHESTGQILEQRGRLGEKSEDTLVLQDPVEHVGAAVGTSSDRETVNKSNPNGSPCNPLTHDRDDDLQELCLPRSFAFPRVMPSQELCLPRSYASQELCLPRSYGFPGVRPPQD